MTSVLALWIATSCALPGLSAPVPAGWVSEPMEGLPKESTGCVLLRYGAPDDLLGMIRVRAARSDAQPPGPEDRNALVAWEVATLEALGFKIHPEPLWLRSDVPVNVVGEARDTLDGAFSQGQAVGLLAEEVAEGIDREVHLLVFHGPEHWYSFLLLTPRAEEAAEVHGPNLQGFTSLLQSLQPG